MGLVLADVFASIASTANSLLVAMAQATRDLLGGQRNCLRLEWLSLILGFATMVAASALESHATVFGLAITSISFMAAGLAPAVAIKVLGWRHTSLSLTAAVFVGFTGALAWNIGGLSGLINEAAIGIPLGFVTNFLLSRRASKAPSTPAESRVLVPGERTL